MFSISWLRSSPRTARPVQRSAILRVEELEIRNTPSGIFSYDPVTRTLVVTGTDPQTLFGFSQSTTATASGPFTIYTMTMDGTFQQVNSAQVGTIIVNGQGAFNTAGIITNDTFFGTDGLIHETAEVVSVGNGGGTVEKLDAQGNATPFMTLNGFQTIFVTAGHADQGFLLCTPGQSNTFVGAGSYAYMVTGSNFYYITGAQFVYSFALNPAIDSAFQYDGSGASAFVVNGLANSFMLGTDHGQSFFNEGVGYSMHNEGIAQHPGDTAFFYDSSGDDAFVGNTLQSEVIYNYSGPQSSTITASLFSQVFAFSEHGGADIAHIFNAQVNHVVGFVVLTA
jgi:hypothetical protein